MKRIGISILVLVLLAGAVATLHAGPPERVNYQGLLTDNLGNYLNGTYALTFRIYASALPDAPALWTEIHAGVDVELGVFNVILGSTVPIPADLFVSDPRWLGITVGGDPELDPRTPITSVPWALRAAVADSVVGGSGGADSDWLFVGDDLYAANTGHVGIGVTNARRRLEVLGDGDTGGIRIGTSSYSSVLGDIYHAGGGGGFIINSHAGGGTWADLHLQTNAVTRLYIDSSGKIGVGTTTPAEDLDVAGGLRTERFVMPTGAVSGYVLTSDGAGNGTWQPGGSGGGADGDWTIVAPHMYSAVAGSLGVGTTALRGKFCVQADLGTGIHARSLDGDAILAYMGSNAGRVGAVEAGVVGNSDVMIGVLGISGGVPVQGEHSAGRSIGKLGVTDYGAYGESVNAGNFGYLGGLEYGAYGKHGSSGNYGMIGTGASGLHGYSLDGYGVWGETNDATSTAVRGFTHYGTAVEGIHVQGSTTYGYLGKSDAGVHGSASNLPGVKGNSVTNAGVYGVSNNSYGVHGASQYGPGVYGTSTNGNAGEFAGNVEITSGRLITPQLQITSGADLSEQFEIHAALAGARPEPGMLVSLDTRRPGHLVVSEEPYDKKVAGVISGAGGVQPGMLMGQSGTLADGGSPVALTGRVYCWADASGGAIRTGDLLTTSPTPGHAMKAADPGRSHGTVIGKAMTSLDTGRGLVLVLVDLQ